MLTAKQVASRVTGFSCPIFGASWKPVKADIDIAQKVITFLEDRRILYNEYEVERPEHCVRSVEKMREFLTSVLVTVQNRQGLPAQLRVMRAACRKFMDNVQPTRGRKLDPFTPADGWAIASQLGDLRTTIGVHAAIICAMYGLGVEGDLATVLPPPPSDD